MPGPEITAIGPALTLLLAAAGLLAASGVPGLLLPWRSPWGPRSATVLVIAGSALGLLGAALTLGGAAGGALRFPIAALGGQGVLEADALGAFFALPVLLVGTAGSIYSLAYWPPARHPRNGRRLRLAYGVTLASMLCVLMARDAVVFLTAWEAMTLATFFMVTTEEHLAAPRRAGWLYLLFSHAGILGLLASFLLLARMQGDFALRPLAAGASPALATWVFALALLGFGIKAGMMPFHSWLPGAHAAAPSHVSALMSGVMIKMGIYGMVRISGLLPEPPAAWGGTLLVLGATSALFGVVFALGQHDLKRLLAYHSIENIGIILLGLGLALLGRSAGREDWTLLGIGGGLLHVWNHALFKSLLFFGAGGVVHATGTRAIDRTGGLARRMPLTAFLFLVGAVAICGLPPANGFVSELLIYLGLFRTAVGGAGSWTTAALAAPVLAAVGALAVACFVKVYGVVFLGLPRSRRAERAHESPALMLAPMAVLAGCCLVLGVMPWLAAPILERAAAVWAPGAVGPPGALWRWAPLAEITPVALVLAAGMALLAVAVLPALRRARRRQPALPTWDCGYAVASPRLQYTASSFARLITERFAWALRPHVHRPGLRQIFPGRRHFETHVEDSILRDLLQPMARTVLSAAARLRALPRGQMQRYILYIGVALALLLLGSLVPGLLGG